MMMTFGNRLKALRIGKGMTQRETAEMIGVDAPMYNRYEHGERMVRREKVGRLAECYGITEDELMKYWLADRICSLLAYEHCAVDAIKIASKEISRHDYKAKGY